jgi:dipeptidyl aminopeptidase/acylaminoacyl peptidase
MKRLFLVMLLLCLAAQVLAQSGDGAIDNGKLLIFSEGKQVGAEAFSVSTINASESSNSLAVGGQSVNFKTRTGYQGKRPVSFTLEQEPNVKLQFAIEGTQVKMTGLKEASAQTDAEALIFESNVWHQYHFLVQRYDKQKGGEQQFRAFVPSVMQTFPVTMELKGSVNPLPDKTLTLEHYRAVIANTASIEILTDAKGRLIYVHEPLQKAEAVREEHAPFIAQFRAAMASAPKNAEIDYSAPANAPFTAEEVTVQVKDWQLSGTLLLPKSAKRPLPAVITITGSGQQTRDEPVPIPGLEKYRPMRQIAEALVSRGIAVLRVDDRGVGKSTGLDTLKTATTSAFADDVRAQVSYLRSRPEIDGNRIALVGHSEGGIIAPMVASTDARIAAIVLMAGTARPGESISMGQMRDVIEQQTGLTPEEKKQKLAEHQAMLRAVVTGGDVSKYPQEITYPWVKEFLSYDPLPTIRKVRQPILILQGGIDRQVTAEQAEMLEQAARGAGNRDVAVHLWPNLNHLFLPAKTGAFSEYSRLETQTVGDDVLKTLGDWLEARLKAKGSK